MEYFHGFRVTNKWEHTHAEWRRNIVATFCPEIGLCKKTHVHVPLIYARGVPPCRMVTTRKVIQTNSGSIFTII